MMMTKAITAGDDDNSNNNRYTQNDGQNQSMNDNHIHDNGTGDTKLQFQTTMLASYS